MTITKKNQLFNSSIRKIVLTKEDTPKALLSDLLSYIYIRTNFKFEDSFKKFRGYDKFISNDGKGILGVHKEQDYAKQPMQADDYYQRRVLIVNKKGLVD